MAVCARCRPGARGFGAPCEPTRCPGSRIRGKKENNKVINKSQTPTVLPSALEYISALPLASPNNRPPLPVRRSLSPLPLLVFFVFYIHNTHSQCPTPPPAPARPSPPSPSRRDPKRSPERPSQKAPFVLSRAATPAGFDGRFVVEALIIVPAKPNPDLPLSAPFLLPPPSPPTPPLFLPLAHRNATSSPTMTAPARPASASACSASVSGPSGQTG